MIVPYTQLTVFEPVKENGKRFGAQGESLWDRDVVEAFIGSDAQNIRRYAEFEIAPTNERLDLSLNLPDKDWDTTATLNLRFAWMKRSTFGPARCEFR